MVIFPFIGLGIGAYVGVWLKEDERNGVDLGMVPAIAGFVLGAWVAYKVFFVKTALTGPEWIGSNRTSILGLATVLNMSKQRALVAYTAAVLLTVAGAGSVSADESLPTTSSSTTVLEQFDEESGLIWSQIDEQTIEVRLPD